MESYQQLFLAEEGPLLFLQQSHTCRFDLQPEEGKEYRLFFTGETELFYYWKTEGCATALYSRITDSLVQGERTPYALEMRGASFNRLAGRKIMWPPKRFYIPLGPHTDIWQAGVYAKGQDLVIHPGGYLRLTLEIRRLPENGFRKHTKCPPDKVYTLDFPAGTYDYQKFSLEAEIPEEDTANVCYFLEGENFSGSILLDAPFLTSSNGFNILPSFAPNTGMHQELFNWAGINLSRAEWPCMEITLNGETVFDGEFFERCHRYSEKEITLPAGCLQAGTNALTFRLTSDGHDPLPYRLHEIGLVSEDAHPVDIVACPEIVTAGEDFGLLLSLQGPCTLTLDSPAEAVSPLTFSQGGLQYLRLRCDRVCNDLPIALTGLGCTARVTVAQVLQRGTDNVITGTGDQIYINQDFTDTTNYLKWYTQNNIGKLLTIRPTYRWSGTRKLQKETWEKVISLLNGLDIEYSHMVDGREPPGCTANPSLSELSAQTGSPSRFLGRQYHELDGKYCYWGDYNSSVGCSYIRDCYDGELIEDQELRLQRQDPDHVGSMDTFQPWDLFDDGTNYQLCHDPSLPADMEAAAGDFLRSIRAMRRDATRHTGPSVLFKYFCMAGYSWIGAETMDSSTEFLMSALRGAARSYGIPRTGVHHALQWSTTPHDDEMRFRRYRLALYTTWMQGAHEINTEEGLWRMEEGFEAHHRFSHAAKEHLKMQQDFARYVASHTRRGRVHAPVAALHGRFDGSSGFYYHVWGKDPQKFTFNFPSEESWFIPKLTYFPTNTQQYNCTKKFCTDGPIGLVSGNPRGSFDIVPVEMPISQDYRILAYFAYNKAEPEDLDRVLERVRGGATLLLSLAHLTCTTDRADIENYRLDYFPHDLLKAIGFDNVPTFTQDSYRGAALPVADNLAAAEQEILCRTDSGLPLLVSKQVGSGRIVLCNTKYYPWESAIRGLYTDTFTGLVDAHNEAEPVMPLVDSRVQAVVYDLDDGSQEAYFLAVDWWHMEETDRPAALRVGSHTYHIPMPFGVMKKIKVMGDTLVWGDTEQADVLEIGEHSATVQGCGIQQYHIAQNGQVREVTVDFTQSPLQSISL